MTQSIDTSRPVASLGSMVALAAAIGAVAGLVLQSVPLAFAVLSTGLGDLRTVAAALLFLTSLCSLAASAAAYIVCLAMNRWRLKRAVAVVALAAITYICGVLIFPALLAAVNVPGVVNGGALPCFTFGGDCEAGRHGLDAIASLIGTTLEWYGLCVCALLGLPGATATLLVPASIWEFVATRRGWLRPVEPRPTRRSNAA